MSKKAKTDLSQENNDRNLEILGRANEITGTSSGARLLEQMLELACSACGAPGGLLYACCAQPDELIIKHAWGSAAALGKHKTRPIGLGAAYQALQTRLPVLTEDPQAMQPELEALEGGTWQNALYIPLVIQGQATGLVHILDVTTPQVELAQFLAARMAAELENMYISQNGHSRSRMETLVQILGSLGATLDRDQILSMIVDYGCSLLNCAAVSIFLLDEERGDLGLYLSSNIDELEGTPVRVPIGRGIIGHVVRTGETVIVADPNVDKRHYHEADEQSGFDTQNILAVPLLTQNVVLGRGRGTREKRIIGGLEAINKYDGSFDQEDAELLKILATQAGTVLEIAQLYTDADDLFLDAIQALTAAIDAKDPYTEGHSQRVSGFSVAIAEQLGLSSEDIHHVRIGALLHDVGKIGVPDSILAKPGRLTDEEYDEMKKHPAIGAHIMRQVRVLGMEVQSMEEHHERMDGKGYPKGLTSGEISLAGKIVAAADVFDALTSDRPYRKAMPVKDVLLHMTTVAGSHLDEACVEALIQAYEKGKITTQKEVEGQTRFVRVHSTTGTGWKLDDIKKLDRDQQSGT